MLYFWYIVYRKIWQACSWPVITLVRLVTFLSLHHYTFMNVVTFTSCAPFLQKVIFLQVFTKKVGLLTNWNIGTTTVQTTITCFEQITMN
jgi:hypothetical protein